MICLSKNCNDQFVNLFARGSGLDIHDDNYDFGTEEILFRGMNKRSLIHWCWENKHNFYFMDSGYVGNYKSKNNTSARKLWHRIVRNDLQHSTIIERPDDRWKKLEYEICQRQRGSHILLVSPSEKPCKFYNLQLERWIEDVVFELQQYTDREIRVRRKLSRKQRNNTPIFDDLNNCHALVTLQSIAAVEAVLYGVPAFTLAPTAADPVCDKNISQIEDPTQQDMDKIHKWAHHLAYGQFHIDELKSGEAYRFLKHENS